MLRPAFLQLNKNRALLLERAFARAAIFSIKFNQTARFSSSLYETIEKWCFFKYLRGIIFQPSPFLFYIWLVYPLCDLIYYIPQLVGLFLLSLFPKKDVRREKLLR